MQRPASDHALETNAGQRCAFHAAGRCERWVAMDPIAEVRNRLSQYPGRPIEETPDSITVVPPNERGFPVSLHVHDSKDREFAVCFDAWHEEFSTAEEALKCFRFGLTEGCRLKARTSWFFRLYTLECQQDGKWIEESTTGYPYFPFLNKRKVEYFQNRVLPANPTVGGRAASSWSLTVNVRRRRKSVATSSDGDYR